MDECAPPIPKPFVIDSNNNDSDKNLSNCLNDQYLKQ